MKKIILAILLILLITNNVCADTESIETGGDLLKNLNSSQLEFGKTSKYAQSFSKRIGSTLRQINNALSNPGSSCGTRIESALSKLSNTLSALENKGCTGDKRANCISSDVLDDFLTDFQDNLDSFQGVFDLDDDDDGTPDICSNDSDNDGIPNAKDNCPLVSNPSQVDNDNNGIGDDCDLFTCCDSIPPDNESCDKQTIKQCREEERIVFDCIPPLKKGTSTPDDSITFFDSLRNFFGKGVSSSFQTSGGLIDFGGTSSGGTQGTSSGGTTPRGGTSSGGTTSSGAPTETNQDFINHLEDVVSMSKVPSMEYVPGGYTCSDFADDLGTELGGQGFMTTFTAIWTDGGMSGHAITDVHPPGGGVIFVEPQTGDFVNLDGNGDGKVGVGGKHSNTFMATEDDSRIEIYDSKDSAVMAGVKVPAMAGL